MCILKMIDLQFSSLPVRDWTISKVKGNFQSFVPYYDGEMKPEVGVILKEIFDQGSGLIDPGFQPSWEEIVELATLFSQNPLEAEYQKFFTRHPSFLIGYFSSGYDQVSAFITQPRIGIDYKADFAIFTTSQSSPKVNLVEIKRSGTELLTKEGLISKDLNRAGMQAHNSIEWIENNRRTYVDQVIGEISKLPVYPKVKKNGSFSLHKYTDIESYIKLFGGKAMVKTNYTIVIGRWSKLNAGERNYVLQSERNKEYSIISYEQLIRKALASCYESIV